jgi:hypothetical protein
MGLPDTANEPNVEDAQANVDVEVDEQVPRERQRSHCFGRARRAPRCGILHRHVVSDESGCDLLITVEVRQ